MTPHYESAEVTLYHGDCLDVLRELPDCSVDAVVTDPPYGLEFMGKEWDGSDGFRRSLNIADVDRDNPFGRASRTSPEYRAGSLFQRWCEAWSRECLRVLKPGGHMLAFGGTRTWHRLACAVEDAGFEIRDSIAWMYGSGFPKSLDVSKAIDRQRTEDRAPVDAVRSWLNTRRLEAEFSHDAVNKHFGHASNGGGSSSAWMTNPTSRSLPTWDQWQELKSLFGFGDEMDAEVWRLNGRKGKPGDNFEAREVVGEGVAGLTAGSIANFRGTKAFDITAPATDAARTWQGWGTALKPAFEPIVVARKPLTGTVAGNVLNWGCGALNIDACRVEHASDADLATSLAKNPGRTDAVTSGVYGADRPQQRVNTAGRWPANVILDEDQAAVLDEQSGESLSRIGKPRSADSGDGWGMTATGAEYDDLGGASRFFYVAKADASERPKVDGVMHPTVKPLSLMRWLVRLVTPPGGTILEPFAGSGTTVEACLLEGFRCVAIEKGAEYLPLIEARIHRRRDPLAAHRLSGDDEDNLFDLLETT